MPIIMKGNMIVGKVEQQKAPPNTFKWDSDIKKLVKVEEPVKITESIVKKEEPVIITKQKIVKEHVESPSHYYKEQHGELEKMFNKKSEYLSDMLDLENNK